jgi:hypothetical protein
MSLCGCADVDAWCFALLPAALALPTFSSPYKPTRSPRPSPLLFPPGAVSPPRDNIPCVSRFLNDPGLRHLPCLLYNTTYTRLRLPALPGPARPCCNRPPPTARLSLSHRLLHLLHRSPQLARFWIRTSSARDLLRFSSAVRRHVLRACAVSHAHLSTSLGLLYHPHCRVAPPPHDFHTFYSLLILHNVGPSRPRHQGPCGQSRQ